MSGTGRHYETRSKLDLSPRQREVIALMAAGKTNGEIASTLGITLDGAKYHVSEVLRKLNVDSREDAVAAWRAHQHLSMRIRRWTAAPVGALWPMSSVAKVALAASVLAAVGLGGLLVWQLGRQDEEPGGSTGPSSPAELLGQMAEALGAGGRVLHIEAVLEVEELAEGESPPGAYEAWFEFAAAKGRIDYTKGRDNTTDTAEWQKWWFDGEDVYLQGPDDDSPRTSLRGELWARCLGLEPLLAEAIACGLESAPGNFEASNVRLIETAEWDGKPAIGIAYDRVLDTSISEGPPATPTPTPGAGTPTVESQVATIITRYEFLVDPGTYLPLALRITVEHGGVEAGRGAMRYRSEFLDQDEVDGSLFDPRAAGYRTLEEEELAILDNPVDAAPVYWLGRTFDEAPPAETLRLTEVDQRYVDERPSLITLYYQRETGGRVVLEIWHRDSWLDFLALLDEADGGAGRWPFSAACRETEEHEVNGRRVRILKGYEAGGSQPCPAPPPDEFMAEVYVEGGYVVTLNASIGIFPLGEPYKAFDSPEALLAIAEDLRLRNKGE